MDLSQILPLLASLGPWGPLVGVGATLLFQWLRNRNNGNTPLLDALNAILNKRPVAPVAPKSGDIDIETFIKFATLAKGDGK